MSMVGVLTAAAVVGIVGIFVGLFLGVAQIKLHVETDEREEAILAALPGNNCGGCGFAGCAGLAGAISKGDAPVNACPVGGEPVAKKIASICGVEAKSMEEARRMVEIIATDFEAGQIFTGKVVSIKEFGAFVEFAPGKEGMVHISKICKERINRVEDVLTLGDKVKVVCLGKDKMGRISFSMKDVPEEA